MLFSPPPTPSHWSPGGDAKDCMLKESVVLEDVFLIASVNRFLFYLNTYLRRDSVMVSTKVSLALGLGSSPNLAIISVFPSRSVASSL